MRRYEKNIGVSCDDILCAVAVVCVPVNNQNSRMIFFYCMECGDGDVVEKTIPHAEVFSGMMPRWTNETECSVCFALHYVVDRCKGGTDRTERSIDCVFSDYCFIVECFVLAFECKELIDVCFIVSKKKLIACCATASVDAFGVFWKWFYAAQTRVHAP